MRETEDVDELIKIMSGRLIYGKILFMIYRQGVFERDNCRFVIMKEFGEAGLLVYRRGNIRHNGIMTSGYKNCIIQQERNMRSCLV